MQRDACAKSGDLPRAEAWMEKMREVGVSPNVNSFCTVIDSHTKQGNFAAADHVQCGSSLTTTTTVGFTVDTVHLLITAKN